MNQPLHDNDAEQNVVGGVMVHPAARIDVGRLDPEDFYHPANAAIWAAIRSLDADEEPIDTITIADKMVAAGTIDTLKAVGGRDYLLTVMGNVVTVENIGYHAARLRRLSRRRAWHRWAQRIAVDAGDGGIDTDGFLEQAERGATKLIASEEKAGGARGIYTILKETISEIEQRAKNKSATGVTGIATGLDEWDSMTGGLQPGGLYIIAARPSMGKTALLLNWLAAAVGAGEPALFNSLEMRDREQIERMLSTNGKVSAQTLRRGHLGRDEWIALHGAASRMSTWPLEIDHRSGLDVATIRSDARQWRARVNNRFKGKIGIIAVDYVGLVEGPAGSNRNNEQNRAREISEITRGFKNLAGELGVAFVLLAQLNRKLEERADKRPMMSDLKESGSLEEHADVITFVYRDVVYTKAKCEDPDGAELIIGKQRNGPTGTVDVRWDAKIQRFHDPAPGDGPLPRATPARNWHPHAPPED